MMKKNLILVLSLLVMVCFAGMVFAQASTPASPAKPKTETVKATTAEKAPSSSELFHTQRTVSTLHKLNHPARL